MSELGLLVSFRTWRGRKGANGAKGVRDCRGLTLFCGWGTGGTLSSKQFPNLGYFGTVGVDGDHHGRGIDSFDQEGCIYTNRRRWDAGIHFIHAVRPFRRCELQLWFRWLNGGINCDASDAHESRCSLCDRRTVLQPRADSAKPETRLSKVWHRIRSFAICFNSRIDIMVTSSSIAKVISSASPHENPLQLISLLIKKKKKLMRALGMQTLISVSCSPTHPARSASKWPPSNYRRIISTSSAATRARISSNSRTSSSARSGPLVNMRRGLSPSSN